MKRSELIAQVAERAETSKAAAARVMDAIFDATTGTIAEAVRAGQQVSIPGFGKFKPKRRPARKGRNPKTGAEIDIPERTVVSFSAGKGLRDSLEGKPAARKPRAPAKAGSGAARGGTSGKAGSSAKGGGTAKAAGRSGAGAGRKTGSR